jgi:hypothetical protein
MLDLALTWFAVAAVALVAGVVLLVLDGRRRRGAEVQVPEQRPAEVEVDLFEPYTPPDHRP